MTATPNQSALSQTQISASNKHHQQNNNNNNNCNNINNNHRTTSASNATSTINYQQHNHHHQQQQQQLPPNVINCSSLAFQQIKQTQASLARLSRHVHFNSSSSNNNNQQNLTPIHQNQQQSTANSAGQQASGSQISRTNTHTFVDCLIRRFKNCFSEDFCEVPVFVVGNVSPGSDGTHLILPPCVSLASQNISRFASAKNLRLLNSIRESCRSVEQLDLGGNKLNDLIEIYKILQCTPNLKFLNLSENDLSRTAPVATSTQQTSSSQPTNLWSPVSISFNNTTSSATNYNANLQHNNNHHHQRGYLSAINQNSSNTHQTSSASTFTSSRRHSSLGCGQNTATRASLRVAEARRLAAIVQTRKAPPSTVASRLTAVTRDQSSTTNNPSQSNDNIAISTATNEQTTPGSHHRLSTKGAAALTSARSANHGSLLRDTNKMKGPNQSTGPARTKSTMHLVRSLSSLSAKDVRVGVGARKASDLRDSSVSKSRLGQNRPSNCVAKTRQQVRNLQTSGSTSASSNSLSTTASSNSKPESSAANCKSQDHLDRHTTPKLTSFSAEPISETDNDVDMSESQPNDSNPNNTNISLVHQEHLSTPSNPPANTQSVINTIVNQQNNCKQQQTGTFHTTTPRSTTTGAISITQQQTTCNHGNNTGISNNLQLFHQQYPFKRTFESIKALALNNTGCQWRVVCSILSRMPNLEELHLSLNNYERIDLDPQLEFRHTSLKRLYLCNNPKLTDWKELNKILIAFPSLEALSIADCNISQIPENLAQSREWRKICGLNINGWPIKEWPVIERLNELPSLIDLKCRNLEILNTIDEPRDHLIARLPNLQRLNGSEIEERDHAEKAFLRFFVTNSHLERPRRFHELIQIHGSVDAQVDVDVDLSPPSQANVRVIYLNRNYFRQNDQEDILMSEDFLNKLMSTPDSNNGGNYFDSHNNQLDSIESQSGQQITEATTGTAADDDNNGDQVQGNKLTRLFKDDNQEIIALGIDLRQSVRKFKHIIANIFGLNSQNFILYYIDHEMVGLMGPELIKHNQKKLWNYNVQDGDQFIVEEL